MALVDQAPPPRQPGQQPTTRLERLGQCWEAWLDIWHELRPMRFSLGILIVAVPFLLLLQQSQDALLALIEDAPGHRRQTFLFVLLWFGWAFSTFYWARFMSRLPPDEPRPRRYERLIPAHELAEWNRLLPHRLGDGVIALVAFALIAANCRLTTQTILIDLAVLLGGFFVCRYVLSRWLADTIMAIVAAGLIVAGCGWGETLIRPVEIVVIALLLWWLYRRVVADRRTWMRVLYRRTGWTVFDVDAAFTRDLAAPGAVSVRVWWTLAVIAAVNALVFLVSAFTEVPFAGPIAIALSLSWLLGAGLYLRHSKALPRSTEAFVAGHLAVAWAIFVLSLHSANTAEWFSSPVIFMAIGALWVFGGTFFLAYPASLTGLPTTTALLVFAALMTTIGNRDNHAVRQTGTAPAGTPVQEAFADWLGKARTAWQAGGHSGPVPLVIVATAGGASRAGYWTTRLLTDFEQRIPGFHNYLFAISSVSGGSVGAGVYRAMLNRLPDDPSVPAGGKQLSIAEQSCGEPANISRDNFARCGIDAVQQDFLSPTFLTGLFADLTQRGLPGALLPDRGTALERAWEAATGWPDGKPTFASDFHLFWPAGRKDWLPALLVNGTSEKTGRRIITSNLAIADDPRCQNQDATARATCDPGSSTFPDAVDFFAWMGREVPFSTAIHNSARFPYIDAAGTLSRDGAPVDRIIDGGYFENFGAATVFDLIQSLARSGQLKKDQDIALFVIQISSDPAIKEAKERDTDLDKPMSLALGDAVAPLHGFYNVRDGLGTRATRVLEGLTTHLGDGNAAGRYFHFRLYDNTEPMSWALSDAAAQRLYRELPDAPSCTPDKAEQNASCANLRTYCDFITSAGFPGNAECAAATPRKP